MQEYDVISNYTSKYEQALALVTKQANKRLRAMLTDFQTRQGQIMFTDENLRLAATMNDLMFQTLQEAGYNKVAEAYRSDFVSLLEDINRLDVTQLAFVFKPKDKELLIALRDMEYQGLFRVEREVANTIQRLSSDYVLTERPLEELAEELRTQLEDRLKQYAMTHIETATRISVQKAEDITVENAGIKEEERFWQYTGPEDNKTRPECQFALGQGRGSDIFTNDERMEFEATYGIRYNCRHRFMLVTKDKYNESKESKND